jgi:DNA (cytosine-5)-methyltransferase 1
MGLDLGLEAEGFEIAVAVECNQFAAATIRKNRPGIPLIEKKIEEVSTEEILNKAGLKVGEPAVVTGGPSCQSFSTAGQRTSLTDPRGVLFREFLRVVRESRPRFFVMENVRGILSAAIKHRPLRKRGPGYPPLEKEEMLGSAFMLILRELKKTGYFTVFDLVNAADYGVPQARERVLFIGSHDGETVSMPIKTHTRESDNGIAEWVSLREALSNMKDSQLEYRNFCKSRKKYLRLIPAGGNWRDLPENLQPDALGGAHKSWGGRSGFFRRLAWDKPSPALTTRPDGKATMLCHPDELRTLSVQEYARIQQFPDCWVFEGGIPQKYVQIGNAVPVGLGRAVGQALLMTMRKRKREGERGEVACHNNEFIERLANRPDTILNPPRMRRFKGTKTARSWLAKCNGNRAQVLDLILTNDGGNGSKTKPK